MNNLSKGPAIVFADSTDPATLRRAVRRGSLRRVDRGTYIEVDGERPRWQQGQDAMLARCYGIQRRGGGGTVVSHVTAALLHGLPVPAGNTVHVTHRFVRATDPDATYPLVRHIRRLNDDEVVTIDGILTTGLERTVLDCATWLPPDWALAVADAALRAQTGADRRHRNGRQCQVDGVRARWLHSLERRGPRRGRVQAREIIARSDPLAESPGESRARCVFLADGLPTPTLQVPIELEQGTVFSDFAWRLDAAGRHLHGEFDGRVKYSGGGMCTSARLVAEKVREDQIRAVGHDVFRVVDDDLGTWRRRRAAAAAVRRRLPPDIVSQPWTRPALAGVLIPDG